MYNVYNAVDDRPRYSNKMGDRAVDARRREAKRKCDELLGLAKSVCMWVVWYATRCETWEKLKLRRGAFQKTGWIWVVGGLGCGLRAVELCGLCGLWTLGLGVAGLGAGPESS